MSYEIGHIDELLMIIMNELKRIMCDYDFNYWWI